ncbi:hypothetical protein ACFL1R_11650 [Candidatus Latescibacterota bacterium]
MIAGIIFFCIFAIMILIIYFSPSGLSKYSGSMTTVAMGATAELMSMEQKKAAEVIVEQKAGKKFEEQTTGELVD